MAKTALTDDRLTIAPGFVAAFHALDHVARDRLAAQERALQVGADHAVEVRFFQIEEILGGKDRGVVDENIDRPEGRDGRLDQIAHRTGVADVAGDVAHGTERAEILAEGAEFPDRRDPASSLTSAMTTRAPSCRKRRAMALPMPRAPPVTMATLFSSCTNSLTESDEARSSYTEPIDCRSRAEA